MADSNPPQAAQAPQAAQSTSGFSILETKRMARSKIMHGDGLAQVVAVAAEQFGAEIDDVFSDMRSLCRQAPDGALFARPDLDQSSPGSSKAALTILFELENIGLAFNHHSSQVESFDIALDRSVAVMSGAERHMAVYHESLAKAMGTCRKDVMVEPSANNAMFLPNVSLLTIKEIDLMTGPDNGTFVAPFPQFSAFMTNYDALVNAQYVRVQASAIIVAAGPSSYLERGHLDAFDQIGISSILERIRCPPRQDEPTSNPARHPTTNFGYADVRIVDEDFSDFETDQVYIVRLNDPVWYIVDMLTAPLFHLTDGMWMPVVHMWSFQRYQMAMDSIAINQARIEGDPTVEDPSEDTKVMAKYEARKFLSPFGVMYHTMDVQPTGRRAVEILRERMEFEIKLAAKGTIDDNDVDAFHGHLKSFHGDRRLWATQSPDVIAAELRALASADKSGDPTNPGQDYGFFCAQSRSRLWASFVKREKAEGNDLEKMSPEEYGEALCFLESFDPEWREKNEIQKTVTEEIAAIGSLVFPVMRALRHHETLITTTNDVPVSELREAAEKRMKSHVTHIAINTTDKVGAQNDMRFTFDHGQCIDLNNPENSRLDVPETEEPTEETDGGGDGEGNTEKKKEEEVKRILALAKKLRVPPELFKAVLLGDTEAIDRIVDARRSALATNTVREAIQARAVALRQENAVIVGSKENMDAFLADPYATDMRIVTRDPNSGVKMLDVMAMAGGLQQLVALSPANAEETITIMVNPYRPKTDTYLAATAKVSKVLMRPAPVGIATRKALRAEGQDTTLLDTATFPNYGQISPGEDPAVLAVAFQTALEKVPGNLTHVQVAMQIMSITTAAALAVKRVCATPRDVNNCGWIEFVFGRDYEVLPYLLHEGPLGAVALVGDEPAFRLRDGCPYVPDALFLDNERKDTWLHDGSVIYMIRARGDYATACLFNSASALLLLFGHMPGGRFFTTGYGPKADLVEWEGLRDAIFAPVKETTGDMFSTILSGEDGSPRLSNPFHLEVPKLCSLFGWTTGVPAAITEGPSSAEGQAGAEE